MSELKAQAKKITEEAEINYLKQKNQLELEKTKKLKELENRQGQKLS